ncbi:DUF1444 family protein [Fictibacillus aquaticus]|uniref:DUF1444 domain-containing protein n=1 Tax=Fictibacillus aquaticus TaxID=2021314 RepID=A0A235FAN4_9BACL|nr:DUF1444 family protein [Fictibacillus aquaticus]OYD58239.1 DUF1444 domain-containing protein [Fictibacillus aquaticus]
MSDVTKLRKLLESNLKEKGLQTQYNSKEETLRVENLQTGKGANLSLSGLAAKWHNRKDAFLEELLYHVEKSLKGEEEAPQEAAKNIFPVIRSTSFPVEAGEKRLLHDEHTAETNIFYALDLGTTYRLITEEQAESWNLSREQIKEMSAFNLRRLPIQAKKDTVAGNTFYFINHNDGYDASRVLNTSYLNEIKSAIKGKMAVAVPHQDVLIIADIENEQGFDVLGQMAMQFFINGRVPVTALSFLYEEEGLEPVFILAKNKNTSTEE